MLRPAVLLCALSSLAHAARQLPKLGNLVVSRIATPEPAEEIGELPVVGNVLQLKKGNGSSRSAVVVETMRAQASGRAPYWERVTSGATGLVSIGSGTIYMAPVTVGGQEFYTVIDTGSSDPWLAVEGFDCVNPDGFVDRPEDECNFGALYDPSKSSTFATLPNLNMNLSYADGEVLTGIFGTESYTMAGLTVPKQQFGLVNYAAWYGDYVSSGLTGFAYSSLTNSYTGTDPHADIRTQAIHYPPLFANMISANLTAPIFSLALSRDPSEGGILALGGIPDIPRSLLIASVPISPVGISQQGEIVYQYYTVAIDGFAFAPPSERISHQFNPYPNYNNPYARPLVSRGTKVIIDSGTSLVLIPDAVAASVLAMFDPPGSYDPETLTWYVDCDAAPPVFGVSIGGKIFYMNPADMVLRNSYTTCISGVQNNLGELTILGDLWMRNVLAVFDLGGQRMGFAAREFYTLSGYEELSQTSPP